MGSSRDQSEFILLAFFGVFLVATPARAQQVRYVGIDVVQLQTELSPFDVVFKMLPVPMSGERIRVTPPILGAPLDVDGRLAPVCSPGELEAIGSYESMSRAVGMDRVPKRPMSRGLKIGATISSQREEADFHIVIESSAEITRAWWIIALGFDVLSDEREVGQATIEFNRICKAAAGFDFRLRRLIVGAPILFLETRPAHASIFANSAGWEVSRTKDDKLSVVKPTHSYLIGASVKHVKLPPTLQPERE
jgi:hypothetical protein